MLGRYIALVSETPHVKLAELAVVAAALQKQVTRDFGPIWGIDASVAAYACLEDVPLDYWPVIIRDDLDRPEAAGYHDDDLGEPLALVRLTDDWTITVSHEMLEMLADPWGRHMVAGPSPHRADQRVKFLVEVCDPCSDANYSVNGVAVSDFYTPRYFDPVTAPGVRYSFTGAITEPRQVLQGGYLTWHEPSLQKWWHRSWFTGDHYDDDEVPIPHIVKGNIRAAIDRHFGAKRIAARQEAAAYSHRHHNDQPGAAFVSRAAGLRKVIDTKRGLTSSAARRPVSAAGQSAESVHELSGS